MLELLDETDGTFPITHISLHTADPGVSGTDEVAGGSYARQPVTWGSAAGGVKSNSNQLVFNIPPGTTITHVGGWDAASGGTFRGGGALNASQSYPTGGTFTINVGNLTITV
ncbi:MAG TPA: hypothetical protein VF158_05360 [Longimicrobiales bacterium]